MTCLSDYWLVCNSEYIKKGLCDYPLKENAKNTCGFVKSHGVPQVTVVVSLLIFDYEQLDGQ